MSLTVTSPVDGARLSSPTDVVAEVTSLTLDSWRLLIDGTEVAAGSGALPAVLDVFDPTLREIGLYALTVEVVDTDSVIYAAEVTVLVDGAMKLGSYDLAFTDASWSTAITSTSVVRSGATPPSARMSSATSATAGIWRPETWSTGSCIGARSSM